MIVSGNQPLGLAWSSYEQNDVGIKLNIFDGNERSSSLLGAQLVNGTSDLPRLISLNFLKEEVL